MKKVYYTLKSSYRESTYADQETFCSEIEKVIEQGPDISARERDWAIRKLNTFDLEYLKQVAELIDYDFVFEIK